MLEWRQDTQSVPTALEIPNGRRMAGDGQGRWREGRRKGGREGEKSRKGRGKGRRRKGREERTFLTF